MIQGVNINEMINQSIAVLTSPSVATFEKFEKRGGMREALTYVLVAAVVAAALAFVFGLIRGLGAAIAGLISGILVPVVGFFVFALVLYYVGRQQGGTGTQDEVFYTVSLFAAPLLAVNGFLGAFLAGVAAVVPPLICLLGPVAALIGLALLVYQAYLAYLAARSSMNLDQGKAIISVVVAAIADLIVMGVVGAILPG